MSDMSVYGFSPQFNSTDIIGKIATKNRLSQPTVVVFLMRCFKPKKIFFYFTISFSNIKTMENSALSTFNGAKKTQNLPVMCVCASMCKLIGAKG